MNSAQIASAFSELGGTFNCPLPTFSRNLEKIKALIFDWDGVFNPGAKGNGAASSFSEADSMGTNMLRFGLWRRADCLPTTIIVTGENNPTAVEFASREHFDAVYLGIRNKDQVIRHLTGDMGLQRDELACVFDDINDLAVAAGCAVRILVRRPASPLLQAYVTQQDLCDYVTAHDASNHAVRETCELLLGLLGDFESVVQARTVLDESYETYFNQRQQITTQIFVEREGTVVPR